MTREIPDPAAVFAISHSVWLAVEKHQAAESSFNASDCYNGLDHLMREVMRIAELFEVWACEHVEFAACDEVWPYLLADSFGNACLGLTGPNGLSNFDPSDCLRMALLLRIPVRFDGQLPLPVDVIAPNPVPSSPYRQFQIRSVRETSDSETCVPFTTSDDPNDEEYGRVFYGLYGVHNDCNVEYIAARDSYREVLGLIRRLVPGVTFPDTPVLTYREREGSI